MVHSSTKGPCKPQHCVQSDWHGICCASNVLSALSLPVPVHTLSFSQHLTPSNAALLVKQCIIIDCTWRGVLSWLPSSTTFCSAVAMVCVCVHACSLIITCTCRCHYYCCYHCQGGWEARHENVWHVCLTTFRWMTLAAPDQLPNWVKAMMEHL